MEGPLKAQAGRSGGELDVVVVGGGPAGAAAAYFLAASGRSVVVIEQKTFPRDKTCGDGLTPRAISVLAEMGLAGRFQEWQRVQGVRVIIPQRTRTMSIPHTRRWCSYGLVTPRRVLDQLVLDNAEAAGATVLYGTKALAPLVEHGTVRGLVARAGDRDLTIRARWLVCAEGATGTVLRRLGRAHSHNHPMGLALRQYCVAGSNKLDFFDVHVDLRDTQGLLPGYGWAFPAGDGAVNVGVGLLNTGPRQGVSLHSQLDGFVDRLVGRGVVAPASPVRSRRGGRLFMGASVWPPEGPGYVLVGDAAGMINPSTGEGIAYAYETGRLAAQHLQVALETGARDVAGYTCALERTYGTYYRLGRALALMMADPERMERLVGRVMGNDRRLRFALTLLLNLEDASLASLDQYAARSLLWLARATRWEPPPFAPDAEGRAARPVA